MIKNILLGSAVLACFGIVGYIGAQDVKSCVSDGHTQSYCQAKLNP